MDTPLEIAFVASEMRPFLHRTEVGAFADALARELDRRGHLVVAFLPGGNHWGRFPGLTFGEPIELRVDRDAARVRIGTFEGARIRIAVVEGEPLARANAGSWESDPAAAAFFARAVLGVLPQLRWRPHVFHVHDPLGALLPVLLRESPDLPDDVRAARSLYSIHDLSGTPIYPDPVPSLGTAFRSPTEVARELRRDGGTSFVQGALLYADRVTAPGPAYAAELQREGWGYGFEEVLAQRGDRFEGIPFGIDTARWNPQGDELLPYRFAPADLVQRGNDKVRLLESLRLPVEPEVPLVTMDAPLADGQGWDLLQSVLGDLLGERVKLALFGRRVRSEISPWEEWAEGAAAKAPDQVAFVRDASEPQFRLELAGSDFFLVAGRREPTGQLAMRAMRYGAVPIVHATGALRDVVTPYEPETGRGDGIVFHEYDGGALLAAVRRALTLPERRSAWKRLVAHLQQLDVSWSRNAQRYVAAYRRVAAMPPAR